MQALCWAVKIALTTTSNLNHTYHIIIWHRLRTLPKKILTLKPHRDTYIMYNIQSQMSEYLHDHNLLTITFCFFHRAWPGTPSLENIQGLTPDMDSLTETPPHPIHSTTPKEAMWLHIWADFTPLDCLSHMACITLDGNTLTSAVRAAIAKGNHCLTSLICQLCTGHCFDANYSNHFWAGANNNTTCPCSHVPCHSNQPHCCIC